MEILILIYLIVMLPVFIFIWWALAHIGIYFYQFNRMACIRAWFMIFLWPTLPFLLYLNERRINHYLNLPFEEKMRQENRVPVEYTNKDGSKYIGYVLKVDKKNID